MIDTLQKIRTSSKENAYANDYGDISIIKDFADRHSLAVVVVHHIRKQGDSDVFNKVSGTTGLTGSADTTFVLEKETRASDTAKLYCVGRDIEYQEFTLRFRDCSWEWWNAKDNSSLPRKAYRLFFFGWCLLCRTEKNGRVRQRNFSRKCRKAIHPQCYYKAAE